MLILLRTLTGIAVLAAAGIAAAEDAYYEVPLRDLQITKGSLPTDSERQANWRSFQRIRAMGPYAVLAGEGEVYFDFRNRNFSPWTPPSELADQATLLVRAEKGQEVTGRLFFPKDEWDGMSQLKFKIPASAANADARTKFFQTKRAHFEQLLQRRIPGAAWFRHQSRLAKIALGEKIEERPDRRFGGRGRTGELSETFALFSGGRAMSENLQLDRTLPVAKPGEDSVAMDSITGITIQEIDWSELIKGANPKLDRLADNIPADQHAVFFPTFDALITMSDEMHRQGAPMLQIAEPRSENAMTSQRYERQLGLSMTGIARLLGPKMVRSVAMTGSDPYYRTGTDVAVLFEAVDPATLRTMLLAQINASAQTHKKAKPVRGKVAGVAYTGVRSPDRLVCSYTAQVGGAVVVTNSLYQLERLAEVAGDKTESLASLPEFTFFRNRYKLGDKDETAFVFLSDATIRRWCGPRWRIGTSRRTRDMGVIAELQATQLDRLVAGKAKTGPIYTDLPTASIGELQLTPGGVTSTVQGSLAFMTPIAELPMDRVTKAEADAYRRWRETYQRNWRWAFDPIGLRIGVDDKQLLADLTIMPLIGSTDYREAVALTAGVEFAPDDGDLHDALAHGIMAINVKSPPMRMASGLASSMMPNVKVEPFSWLGEYITLYADDDPFWADLAKVDEDDREEFFTENLGRIPVVFQADVSSGFKLTIFLTAVRAFIEQTSPGMTVWESLTYNDEPYVKVTPSARAKRQEDELENLAVYYSTSGEALIITLSEDCMKRALDRRLARRKAEDEGKTLDPPAKKWLGTNAGVQVDRRIVQMLAVLTREDYQAAMQARTWSNLPILNTWRRLYPDEDPVDVHQRFWNVRLVCTGGGEYVWNERWQTMESTAYGHPGQPQEGPSVPPLLGELLGGNFGLTFENDGLRASVVLDRQKPE